MSSPVKLTHEEYERIRGHLVSLHGKRILISWVSRRELGFTFREHHDSRAGSENWDGDWRNRWSRWYVDFYDDAAETMFRLTYL